MSPTPVVARTTRGRPTQSPARNKDYIMSTSLETSRSSQRLRAGSSSSSNTSTQHQAGSSVIKKTAGRPKSSNTRRRSARQTETPQRYPCNLCSSVLSTPQTLKAHINSHTRENVFQCEECNRKFYRKVYLNAHMKTHLSEKIKEMNSVNLPFKCIEGAGCKLTFSTQAELEVHKLSHKHPCSFCDRKATSIRNLYYHIMKHTGEFPEKCRQCNKLFTSSVILKHHVCKGGPKNTKSRYVELRPGIPNRVNNQTSKTVPGT